MLKFNQKKLQKFLLPTNAKNAFQNKEYVLREIFKRVRNTWQSFLCQTKDARDKLFTFTKKLATLQDCQISTA